MFSNTKNRYLREVFGKPSFGFKTIFTAVLFFAHLVASPEVHSAPPEETKESIVCRGTSGVGFSYAWGGECWCANGCAPDLTNCNPGQCTPNPGSSGCPDCTHTGTYGADCSGFVSKAWQVPNPYPVEACNVPRYTASQFTSNHSYWNVVSMNSLQPGDAAATSSHVVLIVDYRDSHGQYEVVEAKGCVYGIIRQRRSFAASYSGARRANLIDCVCNDGDQETEDCGDCGTRSRFCEQNCSWSLWTPCEGPDPTGDDAACDVAGGTGVCAKGRVLCVAGWLTCEPNMPSTEVCDGRDNDCDGITDNGTPESLGEGHSCTNHCGEGFTQCIDGALRCVTPGTEWPDDSCPDSPINPNIDGSVPIGDAGRPDGDSGHPGMTGNVTGGCGCRTSPIGAGSHSVPFFFLLGALFFIALKRRRACLSEVQVTRRNDVDQN